MKDRQHRADLTARIGWLRGLVQLILVIILASYARVQVALGTYYHELAENNRLRKLAIEAPRGLIFDRHGELLVENVPSYALLFDRSIQRDRSASLAYAADILEVPQEQLEALLDTYRSVPSFQPVRLAEGLSFKQVARFAAQQLEHPELGTEVEHLRLYRHAHQTAHVLGYLGEVTSRDLETGLYRPGDRMGKKAAEAVFDSQLRGVDGEQVVVVDSRGRLIEEQQRIPARPGQDLRLALDLGLQQEAAHLLEEHVGAIVALDPRNGDVLAMASSPSFNPNLFARQLQSDDWRALIENPAHPLQNRVLQNQYPPGSVFKIVLALAGLERRAISPDTTVFCGGSTVIYGHRYRCWKPGGHGRVDLHGAIRGSCNTYFHHLGQQLGIDTIAQYARMLGLGEVTGLDIGGEKRGLVPGNRWSLEVRGSPWFAGETISVAIGQGPILVTPLQMAEVVAMVANGGRRVRPRISLSTPVEISEPVAIRPESFARVRQGLWAVVNEANGTARGAQIEGLDVAGKTGTAQVIAHAVRLSTEEQAEQFRTHAWFASFAPLGNPQIVMVIFVEHGGAGSSAAAPLAKMLYEKYFEPYLANRAAG